MVPRSVGRGLRRDATDTMAIWKCEPYSSQWWGLNWAMNRWFGKRKMIVKWKEDLKVDWEDTSDCQLANSGTGVWSVKVGPEVYEYRSLWSRDEAWWLVDLRLKNLWQRLIRPLGSGLFSIYRLLGLLLDLVAFVSTLGENPRSLRELATHARARYPASQGL